MKINEAPQLGDGPNMRIVLTEWMRATAKKLNSLAAGNLAAYENTGTAAPTAGTWAQGDFVKNSAPSELGSAGSKYIVQGWTCTAGGTPGTWLQARTLTGN